MLKRWNRAAVVVATGLMIVVSGNPASAAVDKGAKTQDLIMSVRGAGPYRIGATLQRLTAAGLVVDPAPIPGCDGIIVAGATGVWAGNILLTFRSNRLRVIDTATDAVRSRSGAMVGMSFAELEQIYGRRGHLIHNSAGRVGYVVRVGNRAELFTDHPFRSGVGAFQVGPHRLLVRQFLLGGC